MKLKVKALILSGLLLALVGLQSCGFYSFSGTSIPQEVKTFSVSYFENNAPISNKAHQKELSKLENKPQRK